MAYTNTLNMRKIYLEEKEKPHKKLLKFVRLIAVFILLAIVLEVWAVNRLSTYGDQIQTLKTAQARLELENQILENQISQGSALVNLETRANTLGFSAIKNLEYFKPANIASAI